MYGQVKQKREFYKERSTQSISLVVLLIKNVTKIYHKYLHYISVKNMY